MIKIKIKIKIENDLILLYEKFKNHQNEFIKTI
jgi:hypothetical protein